MGLKQRLSITFIALANIMIFAHAFTPHDHHLFSYEVCHNINFSCDHNHSTALCSEDSSHESEHNCCISGVVYNSNSPDQKDDQFMVFEITLNSLEDHKLFTERNALKIYFPPAEIDNYVIFILKETPLRAPPYIA